VTSKNLASAAAPELLQAPEAAWAQLAFFIPVLESAPSRGPAAAGGLAWHRSVAEFPVPSEPGKCTSRAWRSARITPGAQAVLYDLRWQATLGSPALLARHPDDEHLTVITRQLEFQPTGVEPGFGAGGVLILHAEVAGSPAAPQLPVRWLASVIKNLARPAAAGDAPGAGQLVSGWGLSLVTEPAIFVAVNLALGKASLQALRGIPAAASVSCAQAWDGLDCWTWSLARGTIPAASMLRTPVLPATPGQTVALPRRQAIVDRSGVAVMATDPADQSAEVTRALADSIPVFQSVYADVLLLSYLQLLVTGEVGTRLDTLGDPVDNPREFHRIENRTQVLHNRFWRVRITEWPWLNQMMRAVQEQNDLPVVVAALSDNVRDLGNQIERKYQHGLNLILLLLSVIGLVGVSAGALATVAAFLTVFGTGHWGAVVAIAGTSGGLLALFAAMAWLLIRGGAWRGLSGD
jgi:hypothetical protein